MRRNTGFNFKTRFSRAYPYSDKISDMVIPWTWTFNINEDDGEPYGPHYHCWIPHDTTDYHKRRLLAKFKTTIGLIAEESTTSWDIIPRGES